MTLYLFLNRCFCNFLTGTHVLTVVAFDIDKPGTLNSTFHYEIKSVSPAVTGTEFYVNEVGAVSFKGCFDHQAREFNTMMCGVCRYSMSVCFELCLITYIKNTYLN